MITPHRHFAPDSLLEPYSAEWLKEQGDRLTAKWRFQCSEQFYAELATAETLEDLQDIRREVVAGRLNFVYGDRWVLSRVYARAGELGIELAMERKFRQGDFKRR